jgi:hypothetical protein
LLLVVVSTLAEGNALLPAFMADSNTRFPKTPANQKDLSRPVREHAIWRTRLLAKKNGASGSDFANTTTSSSSWNRAYGPKPRFANTRPFWTIPMVGFRSAMAFIQGRLSLLCEPSELKFLR